MSYLFDTDITSNPLKKSPSLALIRRLASVAPEDQFISTITVGELIYGARRTNRAEELLKRFDDEIWPNYHLLAFDWEAAKTYGRLRAELEAKGTPVAEADLRIASIAISRNLVLVTGNVRHFERVPGLTFENWLV